MPKVDPRVASAVDAAAPSSGPDEQDYYSWHRDRYLLTLTAVQEIAADRRLRILDVGAYPPHMFAALEELGHEVHGLSSAHEPLAHPRVEHADLETDRLPWADEYFDLVLFAEVLEHLPHSPVPALREFLRITRPGGHLVLTTPNLASARRRIGLLAGRSVMYGLDAYFENDGAGRLLFHRHNREYTVAELRELLEKTGWTAERVQDVMAYASPLHQTGSTRISPKFLAKRTLYSAIPGAKDNLLAIAKRGA